MRNAQCIMHNDCLAQVSCRQAVFSSLKSRFCQREHGLDDKAVGVRYLAEEPRDGVGDHDGGESEQGNTEQWVHNGGANTVLQSGAQHQLMHEVYPETEAGGLHNKTPPPALQIDRTCRTPDEDRNRQEKNGGCEIIDEPVDGFAYKF